jgi:hypothetical protein
MYGGLEQTVSRRLKARSCEELKVLCVDRGHLWSSYITFWNKDAMLVTQNSRASV